MNPRIWQLGVTLVLTHLLSSSVLSNAQADSQPAIEAKSRASGVMVASSALKKACDQVDAQRAGCWTRSDFVQVAQQQGYVAQVKQISPVLEDNKVAVDASSALWMPPQPTSGGPVLRPVNLHTQFRVNHPSSNRSYSVDTSTMSGQQIVMEVFHTTIIEVPRIVDFVTRQQELNDLRRAYQEYYAASEAQVRQHLDQLHAAAERERVRAEKETALSMARLSQMLTEVEMRTRSPAERLAINKARTITESGLRESSFEMTPSAQPVMEESLEKALGAGDFTGAAETLEALTYGTINGSPISSSYAQSVSNGDGVMQVGGPFDQQRFQTQLHSSEGQIIRRLANRYQALWAESDGLSTLDSAAQARYTAGLMALTAGDRVIAGDMYAKGSALLRASEALADSIYGIGVGLGESIEELVGVVPELAHLAKAALYDPAAAWSATVEFAAQIDEVAALVLEQLANDADTFLSGTHFDRGRMVGRYAIDAIGLFASGGAVNAGVSGAKQLKFIKKISSQVPKSALADAQKAFASVGRIAESTPKSALDGLKFHSQRNPTVSHAIAKTYLETLRLDRPATARYLERLAASKVYIAPEKVKPVAEFHHSARTVMPELPRTSRDGVFSRGISRERFENGQRIIHTEADVFNHHNGLISNDHRYTIGGELGHKGLYMVEGDISKTANVIASELDKPLDQIVMSEKIVKVDNLLDLTDEGNLRKLGVKIEDLGGDDYSYANAIGDVAKEFGFNGILFDSTKIKNGKAVNLVLFE